jgi:hypothetical protein
MAKMMESDYLERASLTYSWFIQACGRLNVPDNIKESNMERAFLSCCQEGLVNDFVLNRLKVAAPEPLFNRLMSPAVARLSNYDKHRDDLKQRISLSHLPKHWTNRRRNQKRSSEGSRIESSK